MSTGYFDARTLKFVTSRSSALLEWMRLPGDVLFIVGGVLPLLYLCWLGVRHQSSRPAAEADQEITFAELASIREV